MKPTSNRTPYYRRIALRVAGALASCVVVALVLANFAAAVPVSPAESSPQAGEDPGGRFGEYRATLTELREPERAAIASDGQIFVVEAWAHRVAVFTSAGERIRTFGSLGDGPGQLRDPRGIALAEGDSETRVFVADTGNHRIVVFDERGEAVTTFGADEENFGGFARPSDVAIRGERLFVADTGHHRIVELSLSGKPVSVIGEWGSGEGQLRQPLGVTVDESGRILVADTGNHRIVGFDQKGACVLQFGNRGPYPGLFSQPSDIEVREDRIYVADRGNHRIQVFSGAGNPLYEWGIHVLRPREGEGHLHYPGGIAIAPGGEFAVTCEAFSDRVQIFGPAQGPAELYMTDPAIFSQGPARHYGMQIDAVGDVLLIAEPETESVLVFALDGTTPLLVTKLGGLGPLADDLVRVSDVAIGHDGREIIATDAGARRISRYSLNRPAASELRYDPRLGRYVDGAQLARLPLVLNGKPISSMNGIEPGPIARDSDGDMFVVDRLEARILKFSHEFELEAVFGAEGSQPGCLRSPSDLSLSGDEEELWVVDSGNARIVVFGVDGSFRRDFGAEAGLVRPHGLAIDSSGNAFVTDAALHRVVVFNPEGAPIRSWGAEGLGAGEFFKPRGIAIDGEGHIIVLDHGNHRGQIFAPDGKFLSAFGARLYVRETRRRSDS